MHDGVTESDNTKKSCSFLKRMAQFWLAIALLLAFSFTTEAGRKQKRGKCQKITIPECRNLGYQRTQFPNPFTKITTQEETNNLTRFLPILAQLNCTKINAMPFLCSVYVPQCAPKQSVTPPCREFCERAIGDCPAYAARFDVQWPTPLECSNYPSQHGNQKCIKNRRFKTEQRGKAKKEKKKPIATEATCCAVGVAMATKRSGSCDLNNTLTTLGLPKRMLKGMERCQSFANNVKDCCQRHVLRIHVRKIKKQERKEKKKQRKEKAKARKQQKKEQKKQKQQERKEEKQEQKQGKQGKKKEKQEKRKQNLKEKKQKKQQRKEKKANRKQKNFSKQNLG